MSQETNKVSVSDAVQRTGGPDYTYVAGMGALGGKAYVYKDAEGPSELPPVAVTSPVTGTYEHACRRISLVHAIDIHSKCGGYGKGAMAMTDVLDTAKALHEWLFGK